MCRKVITALLIVGWVSLSCFDVVEDLDEIPGQVEFSRASPDDGSIPKRGGWGPLANNIVESANPTEHDYGILVNFTAVAFDIDLPLDFQRHFPLHKLYHVFLI